MKHRLYFNQKKWATYSIILFFLAGIIAPMGVVGQDCLLIRPEESPNKLKLIGASKIQPGGESGYELTGMSQSILQVESANDCLIYDVSLEDLFQFCDGTDYKFSYGPGMDATTVNGISCDDDDTIEYCDCPDACVLSEPISHAKKVAYRIMGNGDYERDADGNILFDSENYPIVDLDRRGAAPNATVEVVGAGEVSLTNLSDYLDCSPLEISCHTYYNGGNNAVTSYVALRDKILYDAAEDYNHLLMTAAANKFNTCGMTATLGLNSTYTQIPTVLASKNNLCVGGALWNIPEEVPVIINKSNASLRGPSIDGRLKPDVVGLNNCTSYATPYVAGSGAAIKEQWEETDHTGNLNPETLKALLIHTAQPCGTNINLPIYEQTNPGPDYECGWGSIDVYEATKLVKMDTDLGEGQLIHQENFANSNASDWEFTFTLPNEAQDLKVTLSWMDVGYVSSHINQGVLSTLGWDLDLQIVDMSDDTVFSPWLLDPANPSAQATRTPGNVDRVNNVEQVYIPTAELTPGQQYKVIVSITNTFIKEYDEQDFSVIISYGSDEYLGCSNPMGVEEDTVYYCPTATSVQLEAFGGNIYQWEPATGLSDPTIANPTLDVSVLNGETGYYVVKAIDTDGCWHNTKIVLEPDSCTEDCLAPEDVQIMIELDSWDWIDVSRDAIVTTSIPESYNPVYDWTVTDEATPPNSVTVTDHGRIFNVSNFDNGYLFEFCVTVSYQGGSCEYSYCITMDLAPATGGYSCIADNPLDQVISYNLTGSTVTVNPINSSYYIDNTVTWNLFADDGTIIDTQTQSDENQSISFSLPFDGAYHLRLDVMSIYDSNCDVSIYEYFTSGNTCPDLTVDYPSIGLGYLPTLGGVFIEPGKPTILSAVVNNIGTESTQGGESLGMYLSGDDFVDANDVYLGGVSIPVLGANQRIKLGSRVTIPKKFSRHIDRILFAADFLDISKECLETNNTASVLINTGLKKTDLAADDYTNIVNLSPNPAKDFFTIDYQLENKVEVSFELYTILGKLEKTIQYNDLQVSGQYSLNVDITDLSSGLYLLHTKIGDRQIIQKIMKSE